MTELTKAQFWILDKAVDGGMRVWLIRPDQVGYYFDDYHGLDDEVLVDTLLGLFEEGYIVAADEAGQELAEFVPDRPTIWRALMQGIPDLIYWLTSKGGETWERLANPDWNRYVGRTFPENDVHVLRSGSQEALDEYIQICVAEWQSRAGLETRSTPIITEVSREILSPWEATYWKTLERGVERRVILSGVDEDWGWYVSRVMNWYTPPEQFVPFAESPEVDWCA